ncbi:MAG: UDP-glucose/GDP-mannose dehydrogenase family protein [Acidobacteria bacterium]|nr:UDP-glucose/GDP-mannose dehydrogenase family protein [Acidobacteriota bacterium]
MNVAMIGAGRVGLVAAACLADFGIRVHGVDNQAERIESLHQGRLPFHEPGLLELVEKNTRAGRLSFSTRLAEAVAQSLVVFIAVGTEEETAGVPNLKTLFAVARDIARVMKEYKVLVIKSTVPVGTARRLTDELQQETNIEFDIVSNPEFLREGSAIENFMRPDRVILGGRSEHALAIVRDIYRPLYLIETPIVTTNNETAELAKYASNAFLALKVSFINEIASLCDRTGVDVHDVARALGLDKRIGPKFLHPGLGFGGSCLPKDTRVLVAMAGEHGCRLRTIEGALETNSSLCSYQIERLKQPMGSLQGRTVGVLGLAYKPFTDDVRDAQALEFVRRLLEEGAIVQAYDPVANACAAEVLAHDHLRFQPGAYEAAGGADAVAVLTEWNEFRNLDLGKLRKAMRGKILLDVRNVFDPEAAVSHGFAYLGRGRSARSAVRDDATAKARAPTAQN